MAAPIVYRWDDGNAPVARGRKTSLNDILYACLVTGYGTKPGAGWTREYVNTAGDIAAYRNNLLTGTGFYIRVNGTTSATYPGYNIINGFEAMTSETAGLNQFGGVGFYTSGTTSVNDGIRVWILIADDRAFWFICWHDQSTAPTANTWASHVFFGDNVSFYPDDAFNCSLVSNYGFVAPPNAGAGTTNVGSSYQAWPTARNREGVAGSITPAVIRGGGPSAADYGLMGAAGMAYTAGGPILYTRPYLNNAVTYTFRGWIPGMYYLCHNGVAGGIFTPLQTFETDGKAFLYLSHYCGSTSAVGYLIDLGDWRS